MSLFAEHADTAEADGEWISVADLMAALMVVFLFIAIVYMKPLAEEQARVREIAVAWQASESAIHEALVAEFEADLPRWDAEIEPSTLLIRFRSPDILFKEGKGELESGFRAILDDFFPRYAATLAEYAEDIEEIRIEGHTSSSWGGAPAHEAYFRNMALSQRRTRSVLEFVLRPGTRAADSPWLRHRLTANGLSSSRLRRDGAGVELEAASRRVEFRVRTRARTEIVRILEAVS